MAVREVARKGEATYRHRVTAFASLGLRQHLS
jgi:hypothetical protein